jgi:hypothetical protein
MAVFLRVAAVVLLSNSAIAVAAPPSTAPPMNQSARDLVRDVIVNELHDRERDSHWQYRSECVSATSAVVREQVETDQGPIFRVLERDGNPLDPRQQEREEARLTRYIRSPEEIAHIEQEHQEDENRLAAIMELLPKAFLFEFLGSPQEQLVRIAFQPDPAFVPAGYEARIVHALRGTLVINRTLRRMMDLRGTLGERVDFGYGLLGHVDKGGTFEIHRRQVSAEHWKTDLVEVHVAGKVLMLKTVGKDQREIRRDFLPVPQGTTLSEAKERLSEAAGTASQARLLPPHAAPHR